MSLNCLFGGQNNNNQFDLFVVLPELITELSMGSREEEEVMCFVESQGVDGHLGDVFFAFYVSLLPRWFGMVLT